jgi:bifunctional non-homologous end joining protein LigD
MIVWDRGHWEPVFDADKGLKKGHLEFMLHGHRLHGRWPLVRMRPRPGEKKEQWLLIKADDEFARPAGEPDITEEETTSAVSGRTTQELAAEGELRKDHAGRAQVKAARTMAPPDPQKVKGARKGILPAFLEPSLPQVADTSPPAARNGCTRSSMTAIACRRGSTVATSSCLTRKALDWTSRFAPIATALKTLGLSSALIDGEIVVEDSAGFPNFTLLQADLSALRSDRFRYFVFDLYYCEGFDLTQASLIDRKALLQQIVDGAGGSLIRFSEHIAGDGPTLFEHACKLGLEGIVSKRADLPYRRGRGDYWLKVKATMRQEFIILGYIPSTVAKGLVGALLMGYFDRGTLYYAGRVGTGYSSGQAKQLRDALEEIAAPKPKLGNALPDGEGVRWAKPRLVCGRVPRLTRTS